MADDWRDTCMVDPALLRQRRMAQMEWETHLYRKGRAAASQTKQAAATATTKPDLQANVRSTGHLPHPDVVQRQREFVEHVTMFGKPNGYGVPRPAPSERRTALWMGAMTLLVIWLVLYSSTVPPPQGRLDVDATPPTNKTVNGKSWPPSPQPGAVPFPRRLEWRWPWQRKPFHLVLPPMAMVAVQPPRPQQLHPRPPMVGQGQRAPAFGSPPSLSFRPTPFSANGSQSASSPPAQTMAPAPQPADRILPPRKTGNPLN